VFFFVLSRKKIIKTLNTTFARQNSRIADFPERKKHARSLQTRPFIYSNTRTRIYSPPKRTRATRRRFKKKKKDEIHTIAPDGTVRAGKETTRRIV
jgi:hypothetical protein